MAVPLASMSTFLNGSRSDRYSILNTPWNTCVFHRWTVSSADTQPFHSVASSFLSAMYASLTLNCMLTTEYSNNSAHFEKQIEEHGLALPQTDWDGIFDAIATVKRTRPYDCQESAELAAKQERAANLWAFSEGLD